MNKMKQSTLPSTDVCFSLPFPDSLLVCLTLSVRYITNIDRRNCNSIEVQGFLLRFASYELVPALSNFLIQQLFFLEY